MKHVFSENLTYMYYYYEKQHVALQDSLFIILSKMFKWHKLVFFNFIED